MSTIEEHNTNTCLNCNQVIQKKYCANCGQKTDTKRFSIKYIITHDILHGVFHIDRGFLYTIRELFTRPGHSIRDYIDGKRIRHFHFFTLIVVLLLFDKIFSLSVSYDSLDFDPDWSPKILKAYTSFFKDNMKIFTLGIIPLQALMSYWLFRKSKLNYSEHLVITSYLIGAMLIIGLLYPVVINLFSNSAALMPVLLGIDVIKIGYSVFLIYQFFEPLNVYKKSSVFFRSLLSAVLIQFIIYTTSYLIVNLILMG